MVPQLPYLKATRIPIGKCKVMKEFYVKVEGWIKIDPSTIMAQDFVGDLPETMTVAEWSELPEEIRGAYDLQDYESAIRNAIYFDLDECRVNCVTTDISQTSNGDSNKTAE